MIHEYEMINALKKSSKFPEKRGYETTNKREYVRERVPNNCNSITSRDTIK